VTKVGAFSGQQPSSVQWSSGHSTFKIPCGPHHGTCASPDMTRTASCPAMILQHSHSTTDIQDWANTPSPARPRLSNAHLHPHPRHLPPLGGGRGGTRHHIALLCGATARLPLSCPRQQLQVVGTEIRCCLVRSPLAAALQSGLVRCRATREHYVKAPLQVVVDSFPSLDPCESFHSSWSTAFLYLSPVMTTHRAGTVCTA
jgi:hypothetical protein